MQRIDIISVIQMDQKKRGEMMRFHRREYRKTQLHTWCCLCNGCITCCICRYFHRHYSSWMWNQWCWNSGGCSMSLLQHAFFFSIVESSYIWKNMSGGEWWCRWKACSDVFNSFVKAGFFKTSGDVICVKILKCILDLLTHAFFNYLYFWTAA